MLQVKLDRVPFGMNERKTVNPTMRLVETAINNAGFVNGVWLLKSPHRTRKKGAERFRALRSDSSGIRVRCKPGGNDTCYEWTLGIPEGLDQDLVFSELCFLHPGTIQPTKSLSSLRRDVAVVGGLVELISEDPKPGILPSSENRVVEVSDTLCPASSIPERLQESAESREESRMAEDESMLDRALVLFAGVADGSGFAKRAELSDSLINGLSLDEFLRDSRIYDSKQAAMRALMMALCGKGYLDRVMYGKKSTNGYRLTDVGRERLSHLGAPSLESEFRRELDSIVGEESEVTVRENSKDSESGVPVREKAEAKTRTIDGIRGLIAEHDSLGVKVGELKELLGVLGAEREDRELLVSGLRSALAEKRSERQRLDSEISRMEEKLISCEDAAGKAVGDEEKLREEMDGLKARLEELERMLTAGS